MLFKNLKLIVDILNLSYDNTLIDIILNKHMTNILCAGGI